MSLLRSGASKKYSDNWASAFGGSIGTKKKASGATTGPKATAKKSKTKPRKKASKK